MAKNESSTESTTQNISQQAVASEGSTAVGAGANVNVSVENLSADVAEDALTSVTEVSKRALDVTGDTAYTAIRQTGDTARDALDFGENVQGRSYDFALRNVEVNAEATNRARNENFQLARQTGEMIAAQAGVVAPAAIADQLNTQNRTIMIVIGAALIGLFMFKKLK